MLQLSQPPEHQPQQADDEPAEHGVDRDRDQVVELDDDALEGGCPRQAEEDPQEWGGDGVDETGKDVIGIGGHQLQQEAQEDQAVQNPKAQLDQSRDTPHGLLVEREQFRPRRLSFRRQCGMIGCCRLHSIGPTELIHYMLLSLGREKAIARNAYGYIESNDGFLSVLRISAQTTAPRSSRTRGC